MCYLNVHHEGAICDGSGYMNGLDENLKSLMFWNSGIIIINATIT